MNSTPRAKLLWGDLEHDAELPSLPLWWQSEESTFQRLNTSSQRNEYDMNDNATVALLHDSICNGDFDHAMLILDVHNAAISENDAERPSLPHGRHSAKSTFQRFRTSIQSNEFDMNDNATVVLLNDSIFNGDFWNPAMVIFDAIVVFLNDSIFNGDFFNPVMIIFDVHNAAISGNDAERPSSLPHGRHSEESTFQRLRTYSIQSKEHHMNDNATVVLLNDSIFNGDFLNPAMVIFDATVVFLNDSIFNGDFFNPVMIIFDVHNAAISGNDAERPSPLPHGRHSEESTFQRLRTYSIQSKEHHMNDNATVVLLNDSIFNGDFLNPAMVIFDATVVFLNDSIFNGDFFNPVTIIFDVHNAAISGNDAERPSPLPHGRHSEESTFQRLRTYSIQSKEHYMNDNATVVLLNDSIFNGDFWNPAMVIFDATVVFLNDSIFNGDFFNPVMIIFDVHNAAISGNDAERPSPLPHGRHSEESTFQRLRTYSTQSKEYNMNDNATIVLLNDSIFNGDFWNPAMIIFDATVVFLNDSIFNGDFFNPVMIIFDVHNAAISGNDAERPSPLPHGRHSEESTFQRLRTYSTQSKEHYMNDNATIVLLNDSIFNGDFWNPAMIIFDATVVFLNDSIFNGDFFNPVMIIFDVHNAAISGNDAERPSSLPHGRHSEESTFQRLRTYSTQSKEYNMNDNATNVLLNDSIFNGDFWNPAMIIFDAIVVFLNDSIFNGDFFNPVMIIFDVHNAAISGNDAERPSSLPHGRHSEESTFQRLRTYSIQSKEYNMNDNATVVLLNDSIFHGDFWNPAMIIFDAIVVFLNDSIFNGDFFNPVMIIFDVHNAAISENDAERPSSLPHGRHSEESTFQRLRTYSIQSKEHNMNDNATVVLLNDSIFNGDCNLPMIIFDVEKPGVSGHSLPGKMKTLVEHPHAAVYAKVISCTNHKRADGKRPDGTLLPADTSPVMRMRLRGGGPPGNDWLGQPGLPPGPVIIVENSAIYEGARRASASNLSLSYDSALRVDMRKLVRLCGHVDEEIALARVYVSCKRGGRNDSQWREMCKGLDVDISECSITGEEKHVSQKIIDLLVSDSSALAVQMCACSNGRRSLSAKRTYDLFISHGKYSYTVEQLLHDGFQVRIFSFRELLDNAYLILLAQFDNLSIAYLDEVLHRFSFREQCSQYTLKNIPAARTMIFTRLQQRPLQQRPVQENPLDVTTVNCISSFLQDVECAVQVLQVISAVFVVFPKQDEGILDLYFVKAKNKVKELDVKLDVKVLNYPDFVQQYCKTPWTLQWFNLPATAPRQSEEHADATPRCRYRIFCRFGLRCLKRHTAREKEFFNLRLSKSGIHLTAESSICPRCLRRGDQCDHGNGCKAAERELMPDELKMLIDNKCVSLSSSTVAFSPTTKLQWEHPAGIPRTPEMRDIRKIESINRRGMLVLVDFSNIWITAKQNNNNSPEVRVDWGKIIALSEKVYGYDNLLTVTFFGSRKFDDDTTQSVWDSLSARENCRQSVTERSTWSGKEKEVDQQIVDYLARDRSILAQFRDLPTNKEYSDVAKTRVYAIWSGDSDFIDSVERTLDQGFPVYVFSFKRSMSPKYEILAKEKTQLKLIYLDHAADFIFFEERRPAPQQQMVIQTAKTYPAQNSFYAPCTKKEDKQRQREKSKENQRKAALSEKKRCPWREFCRLGERCKYFHPSSEKEFMEKPTTLKVMKLHLCRNKLHTSAGAYGASDCTFRHKWEPKMCIPCLQFYDGEQCGCNEVGNGRSIIDRATRNELVKKKYLQAM